MVRSSVRELLALGALAAAGAGLWWRGYLRGRRQAEGRRIPTSR